MRYEYETVIICKPNKYERSIVNTSSLCQKHTGNKYKIKKDIIGLKKLAYELKGNKEGYYTVFRWIGTPEDVADVERHLRIDDDVLKFMTVKVEADEDEFSLDELTEDDVVTETEQDKPDALDVLLGLAHY